MTGLGKVVRTTAFKLSAIYIAVFSIFSVFFVLYIAYSTNVLLGRQLQQTIAAEIFGNDSSACATRTFSRAAPIPSPHFQFNQCAHDCVAPSDQPFRRSNSAMSIKKR